jgi:hypothetical protein
VGLRGGYATQNATLKTTATYRVGRSDGTFADATSEYSITTDYQVINIEPMVNYNIWEGLYVHAGIRLSFMTKTNYSQVETLIAPSDGSFYSDTTTIIRTRNSTSGAMPSATTFAVAPFAGLSYAIPIIDRLTVHPEVFYSFGIMPVVTDLKWTVNSLRPGLSVKYKF